MPWIALVSTALGAVVGLGSALLSDRVRWGRERNERQLTTQRDMYVAYLSALHEVNQALRGVSLGDHPTEVSRDLAARAAFRDAGLVQAREHIVLTASEPVVMAADAAFRALRALRDRIAQGQGLRSPGYVADLTSYDDRLQSLRNAIRKDLHADALSFQIPR
ncbi:hypothetical protein OG758_00365 [Streptomyces sp. NBC_01474]|uniref:hypothetical protein n=1 Tax=Streptomyces sp. NBC_01474 TaxID=2903880 RepID=UPI002DD859D2|nr:hypothetical protein [Streptomyces sp. NBC_01474]WSD92819.1 hypothetical protein OG758_00365 [Streptomyces sp. NBC_01474]